MVNVLEQIRSGASRFIEKVDDAWRQWMARSGQALTKFTRRDESESEETWGIVAGEVAESRRHVTVRLEAPGMDRADFDICVDRGMLRIRGEKRFEHEDLGADYHLFEAAYGAFERAIALPCEVDAQGAEAEYHRGVLTVRLPKAEPREVRRIPVRS